MGRRVVRMVLHHMHGVRGVDRMMLSGLLLGLRIKLSNM
jgi:hypothetical protein